MISVLVPVFNVEKYLRRCIESILSQTYKDIELILVDDGSQDCSGIICDEYAKKDSRIKVIHQENGGPSIARNSGLDIAQGEYIGFVDSDDYIHKDMYQTLYDTLTKNDVDLAICNYTNDNDNNVRLWKDYHPQLVDDIITPYEALKRSINDLNYVVVWNKLFKREIFDDIRFPPGKIHQDNYVMPEVIYKCKKIATLSAPLYYYYLNMESTTNQEYSIKNLDHVEAMCMRIKFYEEKNITSLLDETAANMLDRFFRFRNKYKPKNQSEKHRFYEVKKKVRKYSWKYRKNIRKKELLYFEFPRLFALLHYIKKTF